MPGSGKPSVRAELASRSRCAAILNGRNRPSRDR